MGRRVQGKTRKLLETVSQCLSFQDGNRFRDRLDRGLGDVRDGVDCLAEQCVGEAAWVTA
jgi:hypothetical protein